MVCVCVCVVDRYHITVEIHQMVQTHKKINNIHSVEVRRLSSNAFIHMKRAHHPPLTHHLLLLNSWASFYLDDSII